MARRRASRPGGGNLVSTSTGTAGGLVLVLLAVTLVLCNSHSAASLRSVETPALESLSSDFGISPHGGSGSSPAFLSTGDRHGTFKKCIDCSSFGADSECPVCIHSEAPAQFMVPMTRLKSPDEHKQQMVAMLEKHHQLIQEGKAFFALRGEGPFGSIGYGYGKETGKQGGEKSTPLRQRAGTRRGGAQGQSPLAIRTVESLVERRGGGKAAFASSSFLGLSAKKDVPVTLGLASASIPITQLKDSQYVGFVSVGTPPQMFRPIFDTGSTNIWVVSVKCTDPSCTKVRRFDPEVSTTFKTPSPRVVLDITFGTGRIHGSTGNDTFQVGPFKIENQTFGLVEREEGDIFNDIFFEGIIGMAFAEMSSTGKIPFYDHILQHGVLHSTEFSFFVGDKISALFVGGVDPRFYEPPIHMFPIVREHYWEAKLDEMWVGDSKFCCVEGSHNYVIFYSGTSFNTLPKTEIDDFFKLIPREYCEGDAEHEALRKYPVIKYKLSGVEVLLEPRQYVTKNAEGICLPAYMQIDVPSSFGHAYILGSIFMRHYFTVFRRGDGGSVPSMIGLAKAKETHSGDAYLTDLLQSYDVQLTKQVHQAAAAA